MIPKEEIYDNLQIAINNFQILLRKNAFNSEENSVINNFRQELFNLCKSKRLNIKLSVSLACQPIIS